MKSHVTLCGMTGVFTQDERSCLCCIQYPTTLATNPFLSKGWKGREQSRYGFLGVKYERGRLCTLEPCHGLLVIMMSSQSMEGGHWLRIWSGKGTLRSWEEGECLEVQERT